jgi:hypothetical protein
VSSCRSRSVARERGGGHACGGSRPAKPAGSRLVFTVADRASSIGPVQEAVCAAGAFTASPAAAAPAGQPLDTTGESTLGYNPGPAAPSYFAPDFPVIQDQQLGYRIGGFGGVKRRAKLRHTPVVFVHDNRDVRNDKSG